MSFPRSSVDRRVPGRKLREHITVALDFIGQAIEAVDRGSRSVQVDRLDAFAEARRLYETARQHCIESRADNAHVCAAGCVAAIERLDVALRNPGRVDVDVTAALRPDLGQKAARERRLAADDEAKREAARKELVAAYNRRVHDGEISTLERLLPQLRSGGAALAIGKRIQSDLLTGERRGVTELSWKTFRDACRREGIES